MPSVAETTASFLAVATEFLTREAALLDEQRWDEWLSLFFEDCEFWVPAWKNESELIDDPRRELSHIYHGSRAGLEERVFRIRSGRAPAAFPLPRTLHVVTNVRVEELEEARAVLKSSWIAHSYYQRANHVYAFFGRYEHELLLRANWGIKRKKVVLLNDHLPGSLDFYNI
jgi:3-phenylpropionate/cinnamic acid dioxygenase small subunit